MIVQDTPQIMKLSDEVNLKELLTAVWQGKWIIICITLLFSVAGVLYSLTLPNIYKSEVLLSPAEESQSGGLSGLSSQFGGLASMAGINLDGKGSDKTALSLEIIKSRSFVSNFVNEYRLKPILMATESWNLASNELNYNEDMYDNELKVWVREVKAPLKPQPSDLEVHEHFIYENLSINKDEDTGLVRIAVRHYSPYVAKDIVDKLIVSLNKKMKNDDIKEAIKSIEYLKLALNNTALSEMKKVFYQLIEQQEQTKMLASVRDQYVLKTIDPAVVAEIKDSPERAFICILAVFFGLCFSIALAVARYFLKSGK